jgi:hypothetical protein
MSVKILANGLDCRVMPCVTYEAEIESRAGSKCDGKNSDSGNVSKSWVISRVLPTKKRDQSAGKAIKKAECNQES